MIEVIDCVVNRVTDIDRVVDRAIRGIGATIEAGLGIEKEVIGDHRIIINLETLHLLHDREVVLVIEKEVAPNRLSNRSQKH